MPQDFSIRVLRKIHTSPVISFFAPTLLEKSWFSCKTMFICRKIMCRYSFVTMEETGRKQPMDRSKTARSVRWRRDLARIEKLHEDILANRPPTIRRQHQTRGCNRVDWLFVCSVSFQNITDDKNHHVKCVWIQCDEPQRNQTTSALLQCDFIDNQVGITVSTYIKRPAHCEQKRKN